MATKKKLTKTQQLAEKNKKRRAAGKQTTSKDLKPVGLQGLGRKIEQRHKRMQDI